MKKLSSFVLISLCLSTTAHANFGPVQAVVTQGLFHTSANDIYGKSEDDASFDFTAVSLSTVLDVTNGIRLLGQVIYRHGGAGFDGVNIDYLLLDAQSAITATQFGGVKVGRIKVPYGIFNDSRDVSFTRPSMYLSQSIYRDLTLRDVILSLDGVGAYYDAFGTIGQFSAEVVHGKTTTNDFNNLSSLSIISNNEFMPRLTVDEVLTYRFTYSSPNNLLLLLFSNAHIRNLRAMGECA